VRASPGSQPNKQSRSTSYRPQRSPLPLSCSFVLFRNSIRSRCRGCFFETKALMVTACEGVFDFLRPAHQWFRHARARPVGHLSVSSCTYDRATDRRTPTSASRPEWSLEGVSPAASPSRLTGGSPRSRALGSPRRRASASRRVVFAPAVVPLVARAGSNSRVAHLPPAFLLLRAPSRRHTATARPQVRWRGPGCPRLPKRPRARLPPRRTSQGMPSRPLALRSRGVHACIGPRKSPFSLCTSFYPAVGWRFLCAPESPSSSGFTQSLEERVCASSASKKSFRCGRKWQ